MDEAERCHRLAFIFRGALLDSRDARGDRRAPRACACAEVECDGERAVLDALRADARVEEVAPFGPRLRVTTRGEHDPAALCARRWPRRACAVTVPPEVRANLEDAFVSMVRDDARRGA
jgi:hypothetical protein